MLGLRVIHWINTPGFQRWMHSSVHKKALLQKLESRALYSGFSTKIISSVYYSQMQCNDYQETS